MDLVQNLVDEVRWRRIIGDITKIDFDVVERVAENIYPHFTDPDCKNFASDTELDDLVIEALKLLNEH